MFHIKNKKIIFMTAGAAALFICLTASVFPGIFYNISLNTAIAEVNKAEPPEMPEHSVQFLQQNNVNTTETLREEELEYYETVIEQNRFNVSIAENRSLNDKEIELFIIAKNQYYYEGAMPESKMPFNSPSQELYYDTNERMLMLPSGNLSEQQLLQIVDFTATLNRIIMARNNDHMDDPETKSSESDARTIATSAVKDFYQIDIDQMNCYADFADNHWRFMFEPPNINILMEQEKPYWLYFCDVNAFTGEISFIDSYYSERLKQSVDIESVSASVLAEYIDLAERTAYGRLGMELAPMKHISSFVPIEMGKSIYIVYQASDNNYYTLEFSYPDKTLIGYYYYNNIHTLEEALKEKVKFYL